MTWYVTLHTRVNHILWLSDWQNLKKYFVSWYKVVVLRHKNFLRVYYKMIERFLNLIKLIRVIRERGNWKFVRHSRKQLQDFIFCRSGLNRKSPICIFFYWYHLLKGPDMLIWRLETFGFLFSSKIDQKTKDRLNSYL